MLRIKWDFFPLLFYYIKFTLPQNSTLSRPISHWFLMSGQCDDIKLNILSTKALKMESWGFCFTNKWKNTRHPKDCRQFTELLLEKETEKAKLLNTVSSDRKKYVIVIFILYKLYIYFKKIYSFGYAGSLLLHMGATLHCCAMASLILGHRGFSCCGAWT